MFQLTSEEAKLLQSSRSQFATLKRGQNYAIAKQAATNSRSLLLPRRRA